MAACISAWNKAPAPKWQALDIVGKWMLNSLCNQQQQQPRLWKINCTLAKGKGNCFARYTTKSCLRAIHLSDVFAKKVSQLSLLKSHTGLLWTAHESGNKEMSKRVRVNPISMPWTACQWRRQAPRASDGTDRAARRLSATRGQWLWWMASATSTRVLSTALSPLEKSKFKHVVYIISSFLSFVEGSEKATLSFKGTHSHLEAAQHKHGLICQPLTTSNGTVGGLGPCSRAPQWW